LLGWGLQGGIEWAEGAGEETAGQLACAWMEEMAFVLREKMLLHDLGSMDSHYVLVIVLLKLSYVLAQ
jgi:hypothetical protein